MQYCELFSARAVAKIWLLAHLGRLTDVANHSAVNLLQFRAEEPWINRVSYLQWGLFFMRVLSSSLPRTVHLKIKEDAFVIQPDWGPLWCVFFSLCGLISLIQILPRQQLLNQSYLQEETHLGKFYVERHIMRKIWCCRTGDKSDLNDTEELLATDLAEQTGVLISQWCVPSNSAPVLSCPAETPNFHDLTSSHLTPLLTICPLTHEHSDTMKTLSHRH